MFRAHLVDTVRSCRYQELRWLLATASRLVDSSDSVVATQTLTLGQGVHR